MDTLSKQNLIPTVQSKLSLQRYSDKKNIDGVQIVELKRFSGEDGIFEEVLRIGEDGVTGVFPGFTVAQVNRSTLLPGAIKAWHLHFSQDDVWYVGAEDHALLGLWDVREGSKSKDTSIKIVLGGGTSKLVFIPRGVAHGVVNISPHKTTLIYFVNQQFSLSSPDEHRLPWDSLGAEFWTPAKE